SGQGETSRGVSLRTPRVMYPRGSRTHPAAWRLGRLRFSGRARSIRSGRGLRLSKANQRLVDRLADAGIGVGAQLLEHAAVDGVDDVHAHQIAHAAGTDGRSRV